MAQQYPRQSLIPSVPMNGWCQRRDSNSVFLLPYS